MPDSEVTSSSLKRFELWIGLAKFIVGTVILGIASLLLNHQYQNNQLDLEREKSQHAIALQDKQAEFDYLSKFIKHAMNEDLDVRIRLADYMQSAALSENIKMIWARYHALLSEQRKDGEKKLDELEKEELQLASQLQKLKRDEIADREAIIKKIDHTRREIYYTQDQLDRRKYGSFQENYVDIGTVLRNAENARNAGNYQQELSLLLTVLESAEDSLQWYILGKISSAYRSLRDFDKAALFAEKAAALEPKNPAALYQLAIMQKNKNRIGLAVATLKQAELLSDGRMKKNIQLAIAGYLIHLGRRDEGMEIFEGIRAHVESNLSLATNLAWFRAVAGPEKEFYKALERALSQSPNHNVLNWIDQEVDLDQYRDDVRFKELLNRFDNR